MRESDLRGNTISRIVPLSLLLNGTEKCAFLPCVRIVFGCLYGILCTIFQFRDAQSYSVKCVCLRNWIRIIVNGFLIRVRIVLCVCVSVPYSSCVIEYMSGSGDGDWTMDAEWSTSTQNWPIVDGDARRLTTTTKTMHWLFAVIRSESRIKVNRFLFIYLYIDVKWCNAMCDVRCVMCVYHIW